MSGPTMPYETVIGLEVHVELSTETKIFCSCPIVFGAAANTHICPVCSGMPGALPVLNRKVAEYAVAAGLATHCDISRVCRFDRKNYFYPDNPQNYQISQLYLPICTNGFLDIETSAGCRRIGIREIHMEDDAGKLLHDTVSGLSLADYNRSGVPLLEIVTEPDMHTAEEVTAFLEKLRLLLLYLRVSDCRMQEGSLRADVNLSVHTEGTPLGIRTEMKNLNSFKAIQHAVEKESARQLELLKNGLPILRETRRFDDTKGESYSMRGKEDAGDYRYFPEPDLPPLFISEDMIEAIRKNLPEFREDKIKRYTGEYGLSLYDSTIITSILRFTEIFETSLAYGAPAKETANRLMGEGLALCREKGIDPENCPLPPKHLATLICLTGNREISRAVSKDIFALLFEKDFDPETYVAENNLRLQADSAELEQLLAEIVENHPQSVTDYRNGKTKAIGCLIGEAVKATKGIADPAVLRALLEKLLQEK